VSAAARGSRGSLGVSLRRAPKRTGSDASAILPLVPAVPRMVPASPVSSQHHHQPTLSLPLTVRSQSISRGFEARPRHLTRAARGCAGAWLAEAFGACGCPGRHFPAGRFSVHARIQIPPPTNGGSDTNGYCEDVNIGQSRILAVCWRDVAWSSEVRTVAQCPWASATARRARVAPLTRQRRTLSGGAWGYVLTWRMTPGFLIQGRPCAAAHGVNTL